MFSQLTPKIGHLGTVVDQGATTVYQYDFFLQPVRAPVQTSAQFQADTLGIG